MQNNTCLPLQADRMRQTGEKKLSSAETNRYIPPANNVMMIG
jgi:hypothetical protein